MPVMYLEVPRRTWNRVRIAAALHGLDMEPDQPTEDVKTFSVEITGSLEHLQDVLSYSGKDVVLIKVLPMSIRVDDDEVPIDDKDSTFERHWRLLQGRRTTVELQKLLETRLAERHTYRRDVNG